MGGVFPSQFGVAIRALPPENAQELLERLVPSFAQESPDISPTSREETGVKLALCREPKSIAGPTKRLRDRGDDAHLSTLISEPVATRHLPHVGRNQFAKGELSLDLRSNFLRGDHVLHLPAIGLPHIHVLDKTHRDAALTSPPYQRQNFSLVHPPLHNRIDLHAQSKSQGALDAGQNPIHLRPHPIHLGKDFRIKRIQTDRDSTEPRQAQAFGVVGQENPVRGQGKVLPSLDRGQHSHQIFHSAPQKRLSPGQSHLAHAHRHCEADEALDFFIAKNLIAGQKGIIGPKHLGRHAVAAAKVTAVRDRYPEIPHRALELIHNHPPQNKRRPAEAQTKYLGICVFVVGLGPSMNPLISPTVAEAIALAHLPDLETEEVALEQASGRILAQELRADRSLPPYNRVMMDGICFRQGGSECPEVLTVAGVHPAGAPEPGPLEQGQCWEIMTGACLPPDCDTVVPYELIVREGEAQVALDPENASVGKHIHPAGSDFQAGDLLVPINRPVDSRVAAVAATVGATTLKVLRRPRIAIYTTGDEVVAPSEAPAPHQVRQSNAASLRAALKKLGAEIVHLQHLPDDKDATTAAVRDHLNVDLILLCGGISKGKYDFVRPVIESLLGAPAFHGVAQRPGKPLAFWAGPPPVFALPGNPMSVQVTFHRYVRPFLDALLKQPTSLRMVALGSPIRFEPPFAYSLPVILREEGATTLALPTPLSNSGDFASAIDSDGFIELPGDQQIFPEGFLVPFREWL